MPQYDSHPEESVFKTVNRYNEQLSLSKKPRIFAHLEEPDQVILRGKKYGIKLDMAEMVSLPPQEVARRIRQTCRRLARW